MKGKHYYVIKKSTPTIAIAKGRSYLFQKEKTHSKMYTTLDKAREAIRTTENAPKITYELFTTPLNFVPVEMDFYDDRNPWIFADS